MKNKFSKLAMVGILVILSSFIVRAEITDVLSNFGEFIFRDVAGLGDYGFKFILWIILFTVFNIGFNKLFEKRPSGIIAFFLSMGTVILIPSGVVAKLFGTYTSVLILLLGLLIPVVGFYFVHNFFGEDNTFHRIMRIILYGLIAYGFAQFLQDPGFVSVNRSSSGFLSDGLVDIAWMGTYIIGFMAFWNILHMFGGDAIGDLVEKVSSKTVREEKKNAKSRHPYDYVKERAIKGREKGKEDMIKKEKEIEKEKNRLANNLRHSLHNLWRFNNKVDHNIDEAIKYIQKNDIEKAKEEVRKAKEFEEREIDYESLVSDLVDEFERFSRGTSLEQKIDSLNNNIKKNLNTIKKGIDMFENRPGLLVLNPLKRACEEIDHGIKGLEILSKEELR